MKYTRSFIEKLRSAIAKQDAEAIVALRELALHDFYLYSRFILEFSDIEWSVHGEFIRAFETEAQRKIIVMPRGTFKSSLGSVSYPMWKLEKNPNLAVLIDSEVFTNSKNFLREIRGNYESDRYRMIFGERIGSKWDESEIIIKSRTKNRKEASISVGGIETVKVGQHYDLIIGDDYNSPHNSDTPEKCQKVIDHVRYNMNILNPGGEYVFIGTRYAERDVIGFLLKDILGQSKLAEGKLELTTKEEKSGDETLL